MGATTIFESETKAKGSGARQTGSCEQRRAFPVRLNIRSGAHGRRDGRTDYSFGQYWELNFERVSERHGADCKVRRLIADYICPPCRVHSLPAKTPGNSRSRDERVLPVTPSRTWFQEQKPQSVGLLKRRCPNCWGMDLAEARRPKTKFF